MYEQPKIERWGIFYQERDKPSATEFVTIMDKTVQQFGYPAKSMATFMIKGHNIEAWKEMLTQKLDNSV